MNEHSKDANFQTYVSRESWSQRHFKISFQTKKSWN